MIQVHWHTAIGHCIGSTILPVSSADMIDIEFTMSICAFMLCTNAASHQVHTPHMLHSIEIKLSVGSVHEQEHYLTRELELTLDRLESPAWNLAHQSEQASPAQPPVARVPAAYHPRVGPLPSDPAKAAPNPFPHFICSNSNLS